MCTCKILRRHYTYVRGKEEVVMVMGTVTVVKDLVGKERVTEAGGRVEEEMARGELVMEVGVKV